MGKSRRFRKYWVSFTTSLSVPPAASTVRRRLFSIHQDCAAIGPSFMSVDISPVSPASRRASGGRSEYPLITFIVAGSAALMPAKNTRSPARRNGAYRDSGFATLAFEAGGFVTLQPLGCAHPLMSDLKIAE